MIKLKFVAIFFFCINAVSASDTLHVITHNKEVVVTDPAKGYNYYKRWGVFPEKGMQVRQIVLHVKFACPDSMRCADWDYLDFITIRRVNGVHGLSKDFEIARMLTPYGGAFKKDWKFEWEVDVTDFSLLLRDSVEIEYNHTGYEPAKDRGWKITLDFVIIKGKPVAEPVSIHKIYSDSFVYGDSATSIEEKLRPVQFQKNNTATYAKFRVLHTGHGSNEGDGCGEFCSKKRSIVFNGQTIDTRPIWRKCGDNPLYPQAGTWIYDRANWCPGYLQIPDEYLLPLTMQENTIDINMEPYRVNKTEAVENITAYIIQYKKAVQQYDASVIDIITPTNKGVYARKNPACTQPIIRVANNGASDLKQITINYGTRGYTQKKYLWKGNIPYGKYEDIVLPGTIDGEDSDNLFMVSLSKPNHKPDAFEQDNRMNSFFTATPVHNNMVVVFKTNNQPQDNFYTIKNAMGDVVYKKTFDSTQKNRVFKDTLLLKEGCYSLTVTDTSDNGLEFWANVRGGSGYIRLQDTAGNLVKNFIADFGSNINYNFRISNNTSILSPVNTEESIELFPTRTNGKTTLDYFSGKQEDVVVQIFTDEGQKLVEEHTYKNLKEGSFMYDMGYLPPQRYYIKVWVAGVLKYNKRLRVERSLR